MVKKKRKTRRPFKFKGRMKVMLQAGNKAEAFSKLRAILQDQFERDLESFDAPYMMEKMLEEAEFGAIKGWWHPDAPRDIVETDISWTNRKRGGWKPEVHLSTRVRPRKIGMIRTSSARKEVVAYRNAKGRFARKSRRARK